MKNRLKENTIDFIDERLNEVIQTQLIKKNVKKYQINILKYLKKLKKH